MRLLMLCRERHENPKDDLLALRRELEDFLAEIDRDRSDAARQIELTEYAIKEIDKWIDNRPALIIPMGGS